MGKAELVVEGYLRTQCKKYNILCYKFVSPGCNGVPDELIISQGKTIYIETKSDKGTTSHTQNQRIKEMREHGADVRICHTRKSIDEVLHELIPNYQSSISKSKSDTVTPIQTEQVTITQSIRT